MSLEYQDGDVLVLPPNSIDNEITNEFVKSFEQSLLTKKAKATKIDPSNNSIKSIFEEDKNENTQ